MFKLYELTEVSTTTLIHVKPYRRAVKSRFEKFRY